MDYYLLTQVCTLALLYLYNPSVVACETGIVSISIHNDLRGVNGVQPCEEDTPCGIVLHDAQGYQTQQATAYAILTLPYMVLLYSYHITNGHLSIDTQRMLIGHVISEWCHDTIISTTNGSSYQ
jgi:hypothetical protein